MAVPSQTEDVGPGAGDSAFLEQAYLTYIIPFATNPDIKEEIETAISRKQPLEEIESRPWLFFDETIDVFLILKTNGLSDASLKSCTERLLLSVQAQIINTPAPDRAEAAPASEVIYNGEVGDAANPIAVIGGSNDGDGAEAALYTVWKASIFLTRPRLRLFGPSVVFSATASLRPSPEQSGELPNGYLESGVPCGLNLLEPFARDPMLGGVKPRLSAMRVSRVAPAHQTTKDSFPMLKGLLNLSKKVYPAVHTRMRFSRPNTSPPSPAIIALLEIDFTPYFDCEVAVDKVNLTLPEGQIQDLNTSGLSLPLDCVAHDHITLMYHLAPKQTDVPNKKPSRELSISLECVALVKPNVCTPRLCMAWSTVMDFTLPVNPGFGTGATKPFQRSHRPAQLSIGDGASFVSPSVARPDSIPSLEAATDRSLAVETSLPDFGITMTFTAQQGRVYPGDEFVWTVFVVNRITAAAAPSSANSAIPPLPARKLALFAIPKRRRNDMRVVRPPSTAGARRKSVAAVAHSNTHHGHGAGGAAAAAAEDNEVADAVLDENVVHAMQHSSLVDSTDVVCLSADVRIGPLAPNACHVVEMRFLALKEGIVGIDCIRVVDMGNQEHVDVRDLPVMVVERRDD